MDQAQGLARKGICIWSAVVNESPSYQNLYVRGQERDGSSERSGKRLSHFCA